MRVVVQRVTVPAYTSLGFGEGFDDEGNYIHFLGDHRPMRHIAEALEAGEEVEVEIEWYQVQRVEELNGAPRRENEADEKGQDCD